MILVVAGPAGVGKTTFLRAAVATGRFRTTVPTTTRPARSDEQDGVDYDFVSKDEFRSRIRARSLVDWDYAFGHYYGYSTELAQRSRRGEHVAVAVIARMALRLRYQLEGVYLLFLDGADATLDERLATRGHGGWDLVERQASRAEERDHAVLFDRWIRTADHLSAEEIRAVVDDLG